MKKITIILLLFLSVNPLVAFTQEYRKIKITNEIELTQLSKEVYVHTSISQLGSYGKVSSNGMLLVKGKKAFLFDSPANNEQTKQLVLWLRKNLKTKVVGFIPNHWHLDCMGGLEYLQSMKAKSYASNKTIELAKKEHLAAPSLGFKDSLTLTLDDQIIKCYYLGEAHSKDNIVVWLPKEQILFPGCMVKELTCYKMGNISESNLDEWPNTIEKVMLKFSNAKIVIPGHGKIGGFDLLKHTKDLATKELKFTNKLRRIFQNYPIE